MRILFCCQFYAPSVGGVQELIRQLAEHLVSTGHIVTVATTSLPGRDFETLNGVTVRGFKVTGNLVSGMSGEVDKYREFVRSGQFDVMMVYAAQQWTFDALWEVLDEVPYLKVFGPCGFSGLYESGYAQYYQKIIPILYKFDELIFNASRYRDIDLAREHGLKKFSIVSNGASEEQFNVAPDSAFRARHDIPEQSFLFLTVGSFTGLKGHLELVMAFEQMGLPEGKEAVLILNGNEVQRLETGIDELLGKFFKLIKTHGMFYAIRQAFKKLVGVSDSPKKIAARINRTQLRKRVLVADFPKDELTQAFMAADLFVFASNIEHSPLVLFETAAAGTPFLTVNVGNAAEIAQWTGAGVVCPSSVDRRGYTHVDVAILADWMGRLMAEPEKLIELGRIGRARWLERYTWAKVAAQYESIFKKLTINK